MTLDPHAAWYLSRSLGLVAWTLATGSLVFGSLFSARTRTPKPAWTLAVHKHLSLLALVTTIVHVALLPFDSWLAPSARELLVPGAMQWQTIAVAAGQVSLYLFLAVQLSGWMRSKLSKRVFTIVHLMAIPAWAAATGHFLTAGSDLGTRPAQILAGAGILAVLSAIMWRLGASAGRAGRRAPERSDVRPVRSTDRIPAAVREAAALQRASA